MACERITYLGGCWPTNIGNAFIDLGAMHSLRLAMPGCQVSLVSQLPRWLFDKKGKAENAFRFEGLLDTDLIAVSGMACCDEFIRTVGPTLLAARDRGIPTIFYACGQWDYTEAETARFREFLDRLEPVAFVSRDAATLRNMSGLSPLEYDGLDCAFFLPEAHQPARFIDRQYAVFNFDSMKEPRLDPGMPVFRTHHVIFDELPREQLRRSGTLISDLPQDYLNLYANCTVLHSNRVHACIAALAYGKRAQLYSGTPRGSLFDRVGAGAIRERPVTLDRAKVEDLKRRQVEFLRAALLSIEEPTLTAGGTPAGIPAPDRGGASRAP